MKDKKHLKLLGVLICLILVFLILLFVTKKSIFLALIFTTVFIFSVTITIKPFNKVYYWLIFGKEPTEKQLKIFIISNFVIIPLGFLFFLFCIIYSATPLRYFLRTIIFVFPIIGLYMIYKRMKQE